MVKSLNLLWFNMVTDEEHPTQGFAVNWVRKAASHPRVGHIFVITMMAGKYALPDNVVVYSVGKEKGYSEPRRVVEFYRLLLSLLRSTRIDVCFSHLIPIFTVLGAPLLRARRIPIVIWFVHKGIPLLRARRIPIITWYAHKHVSNTLKLAHHMSDIVVTSSRSAYRYRRDKLVVVGQGIDTDLFSPRFGMCDQPPLLLSVARISPIKDPLTLVEAVRLLRDEGRNVRCVFIGEPPERDRAYAARVRARVGELGLEEMVHFVGAVPNRAVVDWFRRCTVHVNLSPTGALDKAALEAMACGRPSMVANEAFREILGPWADYLMFRHGDSQDLARKLRRVLDMDTVTREHIERDLRNVVVERHNLTHLIDRLVDLFDTLVAQRDVDRGWLCP